MGRSEKTKIPSLFDKAVRLSCVFVSVSIDEAFAMTEPDGSVTVPRILPVDCPNAGTDRSRTNKEKSFKCRRRKITEVSGKLQTQGSGNQGKNVESFRQDRF